MPKICPGYAQDFSKIRLKNSHDTLKLCPIYAYDMPEICLIYAKDMPVTCLRYAQHCQIEVQNKNSILNFQSTGKLT